MRMNWQFEVGWMGQTDTNSAWVGKKLLGCLHHPVSELIDTESKWSGGDASDSKLMNKRAVGLSAWHHCSAEGFQIRGTGRDESESEGLAEMISVYSYSAVAVEPFEATPVEARAV